jgi:hypothetical protein
MSVAWGVLVQVGGPQAGLPHVLLPAEHGGICVRPAVQPSFPEAVWVGQVSSPFTGKDLAN